MKAKIILVGLISKCKNLCMGAALLGLSAGCASISYFQTVSTLPVEAPYGRSGHNCGQVWPHPCFNMTAGDFRAYGYVAQGGGLVFALLWLPGLVVDLPISLCADILSFPWQTARYRSFPENGVPVYDSDSKRYCYMSPMTLQLLRGLKAKQNADGSWTSGDSVLISTSLSVLALSRHGDTPTGNSPTGEFVQTYLKGIEYLRQCAFERDGRLCFRGEGKDPRAFSIAAATLIETYGLSMNPNMMDIAAGCVSRLAKDRFPCLSGETDEKTADELRWLVMALATAKASSFSTPEIESRLTEAKARLASFGKGDGGYYDAWSEYAALVARGSREDFERWEAGNEARKERIGSCVDPMEEPVKDDTGTWRWAGLVHADRYNGRVISPSGFGEIADTALLILQFEWPVSVRRP